MKFTIEEYQGERGPFKGKWLTLSGFGRSDISMSRPTAIKHARALAKSGRWIRVCEEHTDRVVWSSHHLTSSGYPQMVGKEREASLRRLAKILKRSR